MQDGLCRPERAAARTWRIAGDLVILLSAVSLAGACRGPSGAAGVPAGNGAPVAAPAPASLGSAAAGPLAVDVVRVQRLSSHLVQLDLALTNRGQAPIDLRQTLSSAAGGLDQSALRSPSGEARTFVVRDEGGRAQCSDDLETLLPGARRTLFLRFVAFSGGAFATTLEVPGLPPVGPIQVPPSS